MSIQSISQALSLFIQCATMITIIYGLYKFMGKTNQEQNKRLDDIEEEVKSIKRRLHEGSEHFSAIDESARVTQTALLALLDHEIDGNNTIQLKEAKQELLSYLTRK